MLFIVGIEMKKHDHGKRKYLLKQFYFEKCKESEIVKENEEKVFLLIKNILYKLQSFMIGLQKLHCFKL